MSKRNERAGLVYVPGNGSEDGDMPVFEAVEYLTEELIDDGQYADQTIIDLVRELRWALAPKIADANMRKKLKERK